MKNLLIIFFLSICTQAFSQIEFAPAGAEWYNSISGQTSFIPPFTIYNRPLYQRYDRDTLINGLSAKVIVGTSPYVSMDEHILTQVGDSILIWRLQQFHLLYDFGAEIGETIETEPNNNNYALTLLSKDTVIINGEHLLNFTFSIGMYDTLIVNNKFGAINNFLVYHFDPDADRGRLRCYSDSTFALVQFGDMACDSVYTELVTGVDDEPYSLDIHIYPNPAVESIKFELPINKLQENSIKIHNLQGQVVKEYQSSDEKVELDISKLSPGFYFVEVQSNNKKIIGKFVKMKE